MSDHPSDVIDETVCLVDTLRDAVGNDQVNENGGHYWVLIDIIRGRLISLRERIDTVFS